MRRPLPVLILLLVLILGACGNESGGGAAVIEPTGPVRIHAVNNVLATFAQRIGGDAVDVTFPIEDATDPAFWRPTNAQIAEFQKAELILLNGANYAKWVTTATLPRRALVDTSAGFASRYIETTGGVTHSHGPEGEHSHTGIAYSTWLDLDQAQQQAAAIAEAIVARRPATKDKVAQGLETLTGKLKELDDRLKAAGAEAPAMVASHPVYQYLARRYGLDIESVEWIPGMDPTDEQWQALADMQAKRKAGIFLSERPVSPTALLKLKDLGLRCVVFDPGAGPTTQTALDFVRVMRMNVERLEAVLEGR